MLLAFCTPLVVELPGHERHALWSVEPRLATGLYVSVTQGMESPPVHQKPATQIRHATLELAPGSGFTVPGGQLIGVAVPSGQYALAEQGLQVAAPVAF